jgi:hypothetical protein
MGCEGALGCILCQKRLRLSWKVDECKPLTSGVCKTNHACCKVTPWRATVSPLESTKLYVVGYFVTKDEAARAYDAEAWAYACPLLSSTQASLVTQATASVHFSTQPETLLPMTPLGIAHNKCSRQADKPASGRV